MFETLDKLMLAGLGAMSMTRERAEKIFDEYVSRGEVERDRRTGFIKEMMDTAEKSRAELEKLIGRQVRETVEHLKIPTREDIRRIEEKVDRLLERKA